MQTEATLIIDERGDCVIVLTQAAKTLFLSSTTAAESRRVSLSRSAVISFG